ncbi:MAG TPA: efflux RND transporter periplasmic adaptor subunit [Gammaproteobacteria bacterium]
MDQNVHFLERVRPLVVLGAAAGAAVLAGGGWAQPAAVRVVHPEQRDLELSSRQPGTAEAFYEADLGAKVSGYVSELAVDIGDVVTEGQVLARIDAPELRQALNAAAADVAAARSEHERISALVARRSMTERALDEATQRLDTAIARKRQIEEELAYATIEAPFDGIVTWRAIDPGDMVYEASSPKGGDEPLLRVAKVDVIRVRTYVPERESAWVDVGDPATVTFDALPGEVFTGQVARLSGALDPDTRTMQVEIDIPNDARRIRPGYYGATTIVLQSRPAALALPRAAVGFDAEGAHVYVVGAGDTARRVPITIGIESGDWIEVAAGLAGDERVVVADGGVLADGTPLEIADR